MRFNEPLIPCTFLKRYKRFLADVRLEDGTELTVHCPNSGSMKGCQPVGGPAWISDSKNPKRKLRYTLEMVSLDGVPICVNTQRPNALVEEAILDGVIEEVQGYPTLRREVRYGAEKSRIDILLEGPQGLCYVEVKNVSLDVGNGEGRFPDAVTTRGTKHLRELMAMVKEGHRAVLLFCAAKPDFHMVGPADDIDPTYGRTLREAAEAGVEILAYRCAISTEEIRITDRIAVDLL